jgi:hypothetical protein
VQRIEPTSRALVWRGQVGAGPRTLGNSPRSDAELRRGRSLHEGQVGLVSRRLVHGLRVQHAAITDEMRQQAQPVL